MTLIEVLTQTDELNRNAKNSMNKIDTSDHLSELEKVKERIILLDLLDNQITSLQERIRREARY